MRLIKEVREFFEGYEVLNTMFDKKEIRVEIFEAVSKKILQVRIIEINDNRNPKFKPYSNMFCDIKVESNMVKMKFKYRESKIDEEFLSVVRSVKKSDYVIKILGNQLSVQIIEPRIEEISNIFTKFEKYCRKFVRR